MKGIAGDARRYSPISGYIPGHQPSHEQRSHFAPHPHAALLSTDFLLSREGQQLIKERNRVPSSMAVGSPLNNFKYQMMDASIMVDEAEKWDKLWSQLFLKGQAMKKDAE